MIQIRNLEILVTSVSPHGSTSTSDLTPTHHRVAIEKLDLVEGQHVALVGANGSGKTSCLLAIAGLLPVPEGTITFDPAHVSSAPGFVFQNPDEAIVGTTTERDMAFGLECLARTSTEIRSGVDEGLREAGLLAQRRQPPHLLSQGEKQRLTLAAALLTHPQLVLLDEPTSRLDVMSRGEFLRKLEDFQAGSGATILHATHRSDEFMTADRVLGFDRGKMTFDGKPEEFIFDPEADRYRPLWSPLHRFRRALRREGVLLPPPEGKRWNDLNLVLRDLVTL